MTILALWRNWAEGEAGSGLRRGEDLSDDSGKKRAKVRQPATAEKLCDVIVEKIQ